MTAEITSRDNNSVTLQVKINLEGNMMEMEESILKAVNATGACATAEALTRFDTNGGKIKVAEVPLTSKGLAKKIYETPYGAVEVMRHVYQTSKGGEVYCPLDKTAGIFNHSTPRFAKMVSYRYAQASAAELSADFEINHGRKIARSFLQNLAEMVGSIAQVNEESWEYTPPVEKEVISMVAISLDGTCVLMREDGYREAMTGAISLYNDELERVHTIYLGAAPEYGKAKFLQRLEREIVRIKATFPGAQYIGVADGAKSNWEFLEKHTSHQILDFYHATEYLAKASKAASFVDKESCRVWLKDACHRLKHDQESADALVKEMQSFKEKRMTAETKIKLQSAITYFTNQKHRMNYSTYRSLDFPIGSGVTEAACKVLIKQRLCRSGMKWKDKGISIVLSLRALVCTTGRFEQFWGKITENRLAHSL